LGSIPAERSTIEHKNTNKKEKNESSIGARNRENKDGFPRHNLIGNLLIGGNSPLEADFPINTN
jgi:hypothetical protein